MLGHTLPMIYQRSHNSELSQGCEFIQSRASTFSVIPAYSRAAVNVAQYNKCLLISLCVSPSLPRKLGGQVCILVSESFCLRPHGCSETANPLPLHFITREYVSFCTDQAASKCLIASTPPLPVTRLGLPPGLCLPSDLSEEPIGTALLDCA